MSGIKDLINGFKPSAQITDLLDKGADIVDRFVQTGAEKEEAKREWAKLESDIQSAYLADTQQARTSEIERIKASKSWITQNLNAVIALGVITLSFILFGVLALVKVEPTQKDIIIYVLGALTTFVGQIVAYYFGSSKSSSDKTDQLNKLMKP